MVDNLVCVLAARAWRGIASPVRCVCRSRKCMGGRSTIFTFRQLSQCDFSGIRLGTAVPRPAALCLNSTATTADVRRGCAMLSTHCASDGISCGIPSHWTMPSYGTNL